MSRTNEKSRKRSCTIIIKTGGEEKTISVDIITYTCINSDVIMTKYPSQIKNCI